MEDYGNKLTLTVLAVTAPIWGSLLLVAYIHYRILRKKNIHPRNRLIPEKIALMHSELSEALEEYRNGHAPTEIYFKEGKPEGISVEIADTIIRALDFCEGYGIDIDEVIRAKMKYNASRPFKHGGKVI